MSLKQVEVIIGGFENNSQIEVNKCQTQYFPC